MLDHKKKRLLVVKQAVEEAVRLWGVISGLKLLAAILFIMAAGAGSYHQILMQKKADLPQKPLPEVIQMEMKLPEAAEIPEEQEVHIIEPDIEEEDRMAELELMAICVEAEAGNQDLTGKRMVADVILNRVDDPDFPDSIREVITQKYAFSSYWDGGMDRVVEPSEETFQAVQMELEQRSWPGLLFFTAGEWPKYGTPWKQVGDHYFATK